jgi:hypothetical protein
MSAVETAVRELATVQMTLVRLHALLTEERLSTADRHRVDSYFDAFASDLTGLEECLRGISTAIAS